jgi:hypothetical protein
MDAGWLAARCKRGFGASLTSAGQGASLPSRRTAAVNLLDAKFLFASLVWGSVGLGYCIYGKRQQSWVAMAGGFLMIALSYFVGSALVMSLLCLALMVLVYLLLRQGY